MRINLFGDCEATRELPQLPAADHFGQGVAGATSSVEAEEYYPGGEWYYDTHWHPIDASALDVYGTRAVYVSGHWYQADWPEEEEPEYEVAAEEPV